MQTFKQWPVYFIGRILPAAVGFGGVALYTRLIDPASFGTYALLLSVSFLVGLVGFAWLKVATLRMVASVVPEDEANVMATILHAFVATSIAVTVVSVAVVRIFNPALGWTPALLTAACAVFSAWFELNVSIAQARLRVGTYGLLQLARALGALGISFVLILAGLKSEALLIGFALGNCAGFGTFAFWTPAFRGRLDPALLRAFFKFGWPSSASAISGLTTTVQRYLLQIAGGSAAVGIYAATFDFSQQTIGTLMGTATLAGQPLAFRANDHGSKQQLSEQMRYNARLIFGVGFPSAVGLIVLAEPLSQVYLGARFHVNAATIISLAAAIMFLSGIRGNYFEQAFEIARRTKAIAINTALRVALTIAISLWSIVHYGAIGAASAVLASEAVGLGVSIVWGRRVLHVPIPVQGWLKVVVASAAMAGAILLVPGKATVLGLAAAVVAGTLAYGAVIALTHLRGFRAYLGTFGAVPRLRRS